MIGICIPKVNKEQLNKTFIFNVFKQLGLGFIKTITIHGNGCVFVHFSKWFESERNTEIQKKLLNRENIYVVYDHQWGWFWKCSMLS
jgi:hypothetical protein